MVNQVVAGMETARPLTAHGGLFPSRIIIEKSGHVWLTDFRLDKLLPRIPFLKRIRRANNVAYLAPELRSGQDDPTPATDVYSLAVIIKEMLSGVAHTGEPGRDSPPVSTVNPTLPASMDAVLDAALKLNPAARPHTAAQLWNRLKEACAGHEAMMMLGDDDLLEPEEHTRIDASYLSPEPPSLEPAPAPAPAPSPAPALAAPRAEVGALDDLRKDDENADQRTVILNVGEAPTKLIDVSPAPAQRAAPKPAPAPAPAAPQAAPKPAPKLAPAPAPTAPQAAPKPAPKPAPAPASTAPQAAPKPAPKPAPAPAAPTAAAPRPAAPHRATANPTVITQEKRSSGLLWVVIVVLAAAGAAVLATQSSRKPNAPDRDMETAVRRERERLDQKRLRDEAAANPPAAQVPAAEAALPASASAQPAAPTPPAQAAPTAPQPAPATAQPTRPAPSAPATTSTASSAPRPTPAPAPTPAPRRTTKSAKDDNRSMDFDDGPMPTGENMRPSVMGVPASAPAPAPAPKKSAADGDLWGDWESKQGGAAPAKAGTKPTKAPAPPMAAPPAKSEPAKQAPQKDPKDSKNWGWD